MRVESDRTLKVIVFDFVIIVRIISLTEIRIIQIAGFLVLLPVKVCLVVAYLN